MTASLIIAAMPVISIDGDMEGGIEEGREELTEENHLQQRRRRRRRRVTIAMTNCSPWLPMQRPNGLDRLCSVSFKDVTVLCRKAKDGRYKGREEKRGEEKILKNWNEGEEDNRIE
jgi:hypothetical protein